MFGRIRQIAWGALFGCLIATQAMGQATLLPNAKQQFFTPQGIPAASGTVDMYMPSTTTRKTTWKSSTESTGNQNTNPVLLDAGGFAQIYGDGQYRQVVKDADGNTIWDAVTASTGGGSGPSPGPTVGDGNIVGTILPWSGLVAPPNYVFSYGQAISRATYPLFFSTVTIATNLICASGLNVLSGIADTSQIRIGAPVEASCVAPGTTVTAVASTSVTVSNNASVSTAASAVFFPYGNGDGSTTFNVPDLRGQVIAGRNNMGGTASSVMPNEPFGGIGPTARSPNSLGAMGGGATVGIGLAQLPTFIPAGTITNGAITSTFTGTSGQAALSGAGGSQAFASGAFASTQVTGTVVSSQATSTFTGTPIGGNLPLSRVQPTMTFNYIIKVLPDVSTVVASGVASLGGMTGVIACGANVNCSSQTLSVILPTPPLPIPYIDVRSYDIGACSSARSGSDDTAAVQAALTAAAASPFGQTVMLPAGVCRIASPGLSMSGGSKLIGQGAGNTANPTVTQLLYISASGSVLKLDGQVGYEISNMQISYNNPAYNGDLIDARQVLGGVLTTGIHIHDFSMGGTQGVAQGANSLLRVGNTLDVHVHDGFMTYASRGIYTDAINPTNDFNIHNIWFQSFANMPITWGNGLGWNVHDNISEPIIAGEGQAGFSNFLKALGQCASCSIEHNGVQDGTNLGTAIDLSSGAMVGGSISKNTLQGALVAANFGSSNGVDVAGNFLNAASGTNGFFAAGSATKLRVFPNYVSTNLGPDVGVVFTSAGFPTNSEVDNNDGFGKRFTTIPLGAISGGTGFAAYTAGDLLYANSTTTLAKLAAGAANTVLLSGTTPSWAKVPVAALVSPSTTVNGQTCTLGSTCTITAAATGITVGTTTVSSGTSPGVLYNNSGVLGNTAAGTNGQMLYGVTSGAPAFNTMSGDATTNSTGTLTIANAAVTYAKIANLGALSVMGRSANSSGVGADISTTAGSEGVLHETGSTLAFGQVTTGGIANNAVTLAKLSQIATNTSLVNATAGNAVPTAVAVPSCSTTGSAISWATNTGWGCNTTIAAATVPVSGILSAGTGVLTALGVNVGTAGSFVVNGGALGSPSSAGTIPAFTLGGTVAGGGNQINNVVIGNSTPLAGSFTTLNNSGIQTNSNSTAATSASAAASTIAGGLGVTKTIWVGAGADVPIASGSAFYASNNGQTGFTIRDSTAHVELFAVVVGGSGGIIGTDTADPLSFRTNNSNVFTLSSTGVFTFNILPASDAATTDNTLCLSAAGVVLKGSGTLGICLGTSGRQFKTAFEPMAAGLAEISQLKLWNYRYKDGFGDGGERLQYGPTAQDVETVLPDLVRHDASGNALNYDIGAFVPISLHAIQQLNDRITGLESRLNGRH